MQTRANLSNVDLVIETLLASDHPSVRYRTLVEILGESPTNASLEALCAEIAEAKLTRTLLQPGRPERVYAKWQGIHWTLAALAELGYPPGDDRLIPLRDEVQDAWLRQDFYREFDSPSKAHAYRRHGVPIMQGRYRRCASQQSNALWSILKLELADERTHEFVERLLHWQWPDGGWNCDKNPAAHHSSFMESLLPLRALALYAKVYGRVQRWKERSEEAATAAERASEVFLKRHLFLRQADGSVISKGFTELHYPRYWHYDILHGLKVMTEAGFINDPRCDPALELLASKQLEAGGWPAEKKYYKTSDEVALGNDYVDWGPGGKRKMNPWVTLDALAVFRAAGCLAL